MTKPQIALVTGASSGIGRATALELAARGHRVLAVARRADKLNELAGDDSRITALPLDITDAGAIAALPDRIVQLTGANGVDVLVNAAGYVLLGPIHALPGPAIEHQFQTNVFGLLNLTQALVPGMREHGGGRVINISTILGRFTLPGLGAYAASKYALEALSDALRMELASYGISVVLIEPSWVASNIASGSLQQTLAFAGEIRDDANQMARIGAYMADQLGHNSIAPETVARHVASAAEARNPAARYVIPAKSKLLVGFMGALPVRFADRAKIRTVGLHRTATATAPQPSGAG